MEMGYRELAKYYSLLFPLNDRQRGFFEHLLHDGPANSVVDVGCGTGEHLSWFSARHFRSYGLEPNADMFQELQHRRWPGPPPTLVPRGADALPGTVGESVDLVLCLGNTLPHLLDRAAVLRAVRGMTEALSPRGRIVLQTVNFDRVLDERRATFPVIERILPDGGGRIAFFREYDWDALPGRLLFKTRLETPVGERQAAWPLLPLRREEVVHCVGEAGLFDIQVLGDYDRSPFSGTSPALIVVGERRLPPPR